MSEAEQGPVCPAGHNGPWRYVEAIEVWREVLEATPGLLRVNSYWQTGEGFNEGVEDSGYLLCWAQVGDDPPHPHCVERVELAKGIDIDWV